MIWGALAGGLVGTVILSTGLRIAQEVGLTRMDIPLLLGTAFTRDRGRAEAIGYAVHFFNGLAFSSLYGLVFIAVGHAGWVLGLLLGLVHAAFAGGALVNRLLPAVHPRMATGLSDAKETPFLEPPGFLLTNYGRQTALVTVVLHLAYGATVGAFAAAAA
jgi:hypothetical protein